MEKDDLDGKQVYELGYIIASSVPDDKIPAEVAELKTIVAEHGGVFVSEDFPKLRALAYEMQKKVKGAVKKYTNGYFGWVKFEAEPTIAAVIKDWLAKKEDIIRHLLIKTVRENTMTVPRVAFAPRPAMPKISLAEKIGAPKMSEAELDKTIEELVVE